MKKILFSLSLFSIFNCYSSEARSSVTPVIEPNSHIYLINEMGDAADALKEALDGLDRYNKKPLDSFKLNITNRKTRTSTSIDLQDGNLLKTLNGLGSFFWHTYINLKKDVFTVLGEVRIENSPEQSLEDCLMTYKLILITKSRVQQFTIKQSLPTELALSKMSKYGTTANKGDLKAAMKIVLNKSKN